MIKAVKKVAIFASSFVFLFAAAMTVAACNNDNSLSEPPTETERKLPAKETDGYTSVYGGGYTGVVHRVENAESGNSIYGRIFTKDDSFDRTKKYPLLIMSHGYNGVALDANSEMVQTALDAGMVVYSYDFCGGSAMSKSEGKVTEMSVETEISDLESVMAEISSLPYIDSEKVVLFGHSFGGLVSGLTAARHKDDIIGLILHAPAFGGMVNKDNSPYASTDEIPETVKNGNLVVGKVFYEDMWNLYPYEEIVKFDKPVYIMYGSEDTPQDEAEAAYNGREVPVSPSCEVHVVEGAGHNFSNEEYASLADSVTEYLRNVGAVAQNG